VTENETTGGGVTRAPGQTETAPENDTTAVVEWDSIFAAACDGRSYDEGQDALIHAVTAATLNNDALWAEGIAKAKTFRRMTYPDDVLRSRVEITRERLTEPHDHADDDTVTTSGVISAAEFFSEPEDPVPSLWGDALLVPGGSYLIVGGEGGVGKTILLAGLFLRLAAGHSEFLGFKLAGEETPVLILEAEGSRSVFRERILRIGDAYGSNVAKLPVFFHKRGAVLSIATLAQMIDASGAKAVLLDPIGRFHDAEENSNTEWRRCVTKPLALLSAEFGCAFALSDHYVKPSEMRKNRYKLRGAGAKFDDCGAAMRVEYGMGGKASRVLFFDRVRDGGLPDPDWLALSIDVARGFVEVDLDGDSLLNPRISDGVTDADLNARNDGRSATGSENALEKIRRALDKKGANSSETGLSYAALAKASGMGRNSDPFRSGLQKGERGGVIVVEESGEPGGGACIYLAGGVLSKS
jgi:hypothetical protein